MILEILKWGLIAFGCLIVLVVSFDLVLKWRLDYLKRKERERVFEIYKAFTGIDPRELSSNETMKSLDIDRIEKLRNDIEVKVNHEWHSIGTIDKINWQLDGRFTAKEILNIYHFENN